MTAMKQYMLRLTLTGPLGTELTGDTLLGHVCWGVVYHEGTAAVEQFLEAMRSGEPPLIVGDPAPAGFLPNPILPPADLAERRRMDQLARVNAGGDPLGAHDALKAVRKRRWVPRRALEACVHELSAASLLEAVWSLEPAAQQPPALTPGVVAHNTINRITQHTAEEGGLFFQTDWFPDGAMAFDLPVLSTLSPDRIRELFEWGLEGGYGRDASTGKGRLIVGELDDASWPAADQPNAGLALGGFAPAAGDPTHGWWRTVLRRGKLSGAWAADPDDEEGHPFKYPLTLLTAGSLLGPHRRDRPWLGRVVDEMHPQRPEVATCALAPVLPVSCPALRHAEEEAA